jgi:hypothetical protein
MSWCCPRWREVNMDAKLGVLFGLTFVINLVGSLA